MGVGSAIPYCRVRIADDEDRVLPDGQVGHIHISGENVTRGYYENPEANSLALTADGWLRTGDLASARTSYERALALDPAQENARRNLGMFQGRSPK
jgi:long-subunit acyl-CoA synthetase (AMP-forming)